jgi:tRNA G18 (ribose-2'-O)-methylase SpoU
MPLVIQVSDLLDPRLDDYSRLTDVALRKVREPAEGLYIAESRKVIERALAAGHIPRSVLCPTEWLESVLDIVADYPECPVFVGESSVLEEITGFHIHRGALASMHRPAERDVAALLAQASTIVILEDVVDHTNVGAVFRSVAGLGADAVLVTPSCADPLYRRSIRVSMGTVLQVPWARIGAWDEATAMLHSLGFHIAALALSDDATDLRTFAASRPEKVAIVLGTEGDGLSTAALASADSIVTIPMMRGVDSLNVAAASAVALYALATRVATVPE